MCRRETTGRPLLSELVQQRNRNRFKKSSDTHQRCGPPKPFIKASCIEHPRKRQGIVHRDARIRRFDGERHTSLACRAVLINKSGNGGGRQARHMSDTAAGAGRGVHQGKPLDVRIGIEALPTGPARRINGAIASFPDA